MLIIRSVAEILCYNLHSFYFYIVTCESVKYSTNTKYFKTTVVLFKSYVF